MKIDPTEYELSVTGRYPNTVLQGLVLYGVRNINDDDSLREYLRAPEEYRNLVVIYVMVKMISMQVVEWFVTRTKQARAILTQERRWMPKPFKMMEHHRQKRQLHKMTEYSLTEYVYEVTTYYYQGRGGNIHTVYEGMRTCSCGKWQTYHMSCSHAVKCFEPMEKTVTSYVTSEYNVKRYAKAYAARFYPLGDQAYWPDEPFSMVANKEYIRKIGFIARTRYPNQMDVSDRPYSQRCSTCKEFCHDKRLCNLRGRGDASTSRNRKASRT